MAMSTTQKEHLMHKEYRILKFLFVILLLGAAINTFAQSRDKGFENFLKYAGGGVEVTDDFKKDCRWNYALVAVDCNSNSKIIRCRILNEVPPYLQKSFNFLIGYSFRKVQAVARKSLIFCVTFENRNVDCIINYRSLPTEVVRDVFQKIGKQLLEKPDTIVLYQTQVIYYNDSIQ